MIMKLPCKENKCISYPVCISKNIIKCKHLHEYFISIENENDVSYTWSVIHLDFPNLTFICPEDINTKEYEERLNHIRTVELIEEMNK